MRRSVLALIGLLVAAPAAVAAPGGSLAGDLSVNWTSGPAEPGNAWNGTASLALEPGDAATQRTVAMLRDSGRTIREVNPFFVQSSALTALTSQSSERRAGDDWCYDPETGEQVPGESLDSFTAGAVTQPVVPLQVDQPSVDVMRGRGTIEVGLYTDNPGYREGSQTYPFPSAGEYFMPVPGTAAVSGSHSHCGEGGEETGEAPVFNTRSDGLVPFAFALWLNEAELPLRLVDGTWRIDHEETEQATRENSMALPLTMTYRANLRMSGDLRGMQAMCRVPRARMVKRASGKRAVRKLFKRAGFRGAKFAGKQRFIDVRRSYFMIDRDFTSTGQARCGSRGRFVRVVPWAS